MGEFDSGTEDKDKKNRMQGCFSQTFTSNDGISMDF